MNRFNSCESNTDEETELAEKNTKARVVKGTWTAVKSRQDTGLEEAMKYAASRPFNWLSYGERIR